MQPLITGISYEALGLSATPNVTTANKKAHANAVFNQDNTASTSLLPPPIPDDLPEGTIPKGYARIERDADGNIVNVTFADEDAESSAENVERESTPWGKPLPDLDSFNDQAESTRDGARGIQTIEGIARPSHNDVAPTKVVQGSSTHLKHAQRKRQRPNAFAELESQAASAGPSKKRFASTIEAAWLKDSESTVPYSFSAKCSHLSPVGMFELQRK